MKTDKFESKYKEFLGWQREVEEIEKKLKTLPLIPFDKPIQKGWNVYYELRDDIKNRQDAFEIQQVLDIGYRSSIHINKLAHLKLVRKGKKGYETKYRSGRFWHSLEPGKSCLSEKEWENLPDRLRKYFYLDKYSESHRKFGRKYFYPGLPDYYLVLKARAEWHTHYRERGGELEKRRDFLRDRINEYYQLNTPGYGGSYPANKDRTKTRDKIQKFKKGEIEDIINEKIPKEYDY